MPRTKSPVRYLVQDCGYDTPCWVWQGATDHGRYGLVVVRGKNRQAHRVYYERAKGQVDPRLDTHHECHNKLCVNPAHIAPLTRRDHALRHAAIPDARLRCVRILAGEGMTTANLAAIFGCCKTSIWNVLHRQRIEQVTP